MDFELIERHPWATAGIIGLGALILYLVLKRGSSSASSDTSYQGGTTTVAADPNAAAASLAQYQTQAQLQALGIQSQTQLGLATIQAGPNYTVAQSADVQNTQTAAQLQASLAQISAQLQLGLNTQSAQVQLAQIQAQSQADALNAIAAAYGGTYANHTPTSATPIQSNPTVSGGTSNPVTSYSTTPVVQQNLTAPTASTSNTGFTQPLPGGTLLVPYPNYASCDPRDSTCVANNQSLNVQWVNNIATAQAANNRNQCLANAELSKGFANYSALVAACG